MARPDLRHRRAERCALALVLFCAAILVGWFVTKPSGSDGLTAFSDLSLTAVSVVGGLVAVGLALRMTGRDRWSWLLLGAGILSWGCGQSVWTYMELVLGLDRPFPGPPDIGYLAMIPLMFAGLITLPAGGERRRAGHLGLTLDAFVVMASIATVSWYTVLGPIYGKADVSLTEKLIGLAYPAGDVLLMFALVGGIARGWIARGNPIVIPLVLGILLFVTSDFGFAYLTVNNNYASGNLIDLGWPLGFLLAMYAAVRRWAHGPTVVRAAASETSRRWTEAIIRVAPYPLVLGVMGLLLATSIDDSIPTDAVFVSLCLLTVVLVLVRQFHTLRENEQLNRQLRSFSVRLEAAVKERTASLTTLHDLAAALGDASSAQQVGQLGLQALRDAVHGSAAILYVRGIEDDWVAAVGDPSIPSNAVAPTSTIAARLQRQEIVSQHADVGAGVTIWIPASDRGQVYGCIAVLGGELDEAAGLQLLSTIGAEFGVAYEDQRRFEAASRNEARFRSLVQNSSDIVTVVDLEGIIRYHSPAARRVFGDDADAMLGTSVSNLIHPDDISQALAWLADAACHPGTSASVEWRRRAHNTWSYVETIVTNLLDDPNVQGLVLNARDISERKTLEGQLIHQAFHDPLSGLANRALFRDRVEHAVAQAARRTASLAVLFLDLDDFKTVNDSLGHAAGDQVLVEMAARLTECVRAGDTIARLGGDEFAILLEDMAAADEGELVIGRIGEALSVPFRIDGKDVFVSASIGITLSTPERLEGADELLRNADVAMYSAKEGGNGRSATFEPSMQRAAMERLELEADLRGALERGEFRAYYQPLIDLSTGTMSGVEALIRWEHPTRGLVAPGDFIPLAEDTGLILPIGQWILREACQQTRRWQLLWPDEPPLVVNVNLSGRQLQVPGLVEQVAAALAETGLPAHTLVLEITESVLMHNAEAAVGWLRELSALGVQLAIDDFGTGYSSLSYLRQFPVNTLKIDKSFVDGVRPGSEQSTLASAIIELGRKLGLKTVAEGIEQTDQLSELGALGCDVGQGYLFARPLDSNALEARLHERHMLVAPRGALSADKRAA